MFCIVKVIDGFHLTGLGSTWFVWDVEHLTVIYRAVSMARYLHFNFGEPPGSGEVFYIRRCIVCKAS